MERYSHKDIFYVLDTFINGNKKHAILEMKKLKELGQEEEFLEQLSVYKKEFQAEILAFYYKTT